MLMHSRLLITHSKILKSLKYKMNEVQQFLANFAENYESFKDINEFFAGKQDLLSNPQHVLTICISLFIV